MGRGETESLKIKKGPFDLVLVKSKIDFSLQWCLICLVRKKSYYVTCSKACAAKIKIFTFCDRGAW